MRGKRMLPFYFKFSKEVATAMRFQMMDVVDAIMYMYNHRLVSFASPSTCDEHPKSQK